MFIEPEMITQVTKEQLVEARAQASVAFDELQAEITAIDEELKIKMDQDEEVIGDYWVKRAKRTVFDISIEKAREYGATEIKVTEKESINTKLLHKLVKEGTDIPQKTTVRIEVKPMEEVCN